MTSWRNFLAPVLRKVADALDGATGASAGPSSGSLPADLSSGLAAVSALVSGLAHNNADLSTAEAALNAVQRLFVDLGIEPPGVAAAISAVEWLLPLIRHAYAEGIVSGGVPPSYPPGGGPGSYRGR